MEDLYIHPRVFGRHPQLTENDIRHAWRNRYIEQVRCMREDGSLELLAIGVDERGRMVEMVAHYFDESLLVYHANTPVSRRMLMELARRDR